MAVIGQKSHLSIHLTQHLGFPEFECTFCDKRFFRKEHLESHLEIKHEKISEKYSCEICPYKTYSRAYLSIHTRKFHKNLVVGRRGYDSTI